MPDDQPIPSPGSTAYQRGPHDDSVTPRDLKVKIKEQTLHIDWQDGSHSEFSLAALRRVCPCASCRTEREKQDPNPLKILKADPSGLHVGSARLVGNYAIQFDWSDGHNTGIFDFRFLRALGWTKA
jgi:DUF971 family protein